jgi:tyrosyl-tRNA synthetase
MGLWNTFLFLNFLVMFVYFVWSLFSMNDFSPLFLNCIDVVGAKKNGNAASPTAEEIGRFDLRVGKIISIERHPDADALYVQKIDLGEDTPRTVVSGLVAYYTPSELEGKHVIVLSNLKPSKLRGIQSEGMVMAASIQQDDKTVVEVLEPPSGVKVGERVSVKGYTEKGSPDAVLNPKQKFYGECLLQMKTGGGCVAMYRDVALQTSAGPVKVKSLKDALIR